MVIYEVNLTIDEGIFLQFESWLIEHAREMLQFPGFIRANILKPENENNSDKEKLTVQYELENRDALNVYFEQFAARMREEGINRFKNQFSAERCIFEVKEDILR
jgi:antibiotic biosynthesis monooxygenase (ABM) superfamily enzyme